MFTVSVIKKFVLMFMLIKVINLTRQLRPRYEGQLTRMAERNRHSFRSLVLTHDLSSSRSSDGRTGTDRTCDQTPTPLAHQFDTICGDGGAVCRGPRTTSSFGPQRELPLARLVIRRQTSAHAQTWGDARSSTEVGHSSAFLPLTTISCG